MKELYPPLYARIREQVDAGRFEPIGSMWVEADCNIPSGESLVRQIVHGKRFFMDEFGRETTDLWLPDVFGYSAALPQILAAAGVTSFVTQKMSWSETNRFPHSTFWWEGIDGTRTLAHFPPADTYNGDMSVLELAEGRPAVRAEGRVMPLAVPVRVRGRRRGTDAGDAGIGAPHAGPRRCAARRDGHRRGRSGTTFGRRRRTCRSGSASSTSSTTGAPTRPTDRSSARTGRTSSALRAAELWSVAAAQTDGWDGYPDATLDELWKLLLLNQFHDIIPGSSIHWVNEESLRDHAHVAERPPRARGHRGSGRSSSGSTPTGMTRPVVVFNAASRDRRELVELTTNGAPELVPVAVPACGYSTIDLDARAPVGPCSLGVGTWVRERAPPRRLGRRGRAHLRVRQGARSRGRRAWGDRQPVPAPRRPSARVRRVERRHRLPRPARRSHRRHLHRDRGDRPAPCRGAIRPSFRGVDDHADGPPGRGCSSHRLRDGGRLARAPQVPEGGVSGGRPRRRARPTRSSTDTSSGRPT